MERFNQLPCICFGKIHLLSDAIRRKLIYLKDDYYIRVLKISH